MNLPAHQLDQLAANGQPQAGAAKAAGNAVIHLGEGGEQLAQAVGGNAHARVGDRKLQPHASLGVRLQLDADDDFAKFGELDGVAGQIDQHLGQAQRVAAQGFGDVRVALQQQLQPLLLGPQRHLAHQAAHELVDFKINVLHFQLARLDARVVQDVVDQAQQHVRGGDYLLLVIALVGGELCFQEQLAQAHNGVHGGANFVAHAGQKVRLGAAGRLGLCGGVLQGLGAVFDQGFQVFAVLLQFLVALLQALDHVVQAAPQLGQLIVPVGIGAFGQGRVVGHLPHELIEAQQRPCNAPGSTVGDP